MRADRRTFGRYLVLARLGQGGMGHVYLAMHKGPAGVQKIVVIKQLREDFAESVSARAMFLDEARIATKLNHPNIVQTSEVVDEADDLYLVMEFMDGQPLSRLLDPKRGASFSLATKLTILVQALEGLHYAHELRSYDGRPLDLVHRDVSPQNIMVTYDGHVKLVDFGVAKARDSTSVTESGVFKGKVRYAAPEQALCTTVDRRADIFAVGAVLWEIITGRRMWTEQADASVMLALASGQIPKLRDVMPDVPLALEAICMKALATSPDRRYATALELRDALVDYMDSMSKDRDVDLGAAVTAAFSEEQRQLHEVIDTQAKAARETPTGAPTIRQIPLIAPPESGPSIASERSVMRGGLSLESGMNERPSIEPKRRKIAWRVGLGIAVAGAVVAGVFLRPGKHEAPAAASPVARGSATVHLRLHALPDGARFVLDGMTLPTNPYESDVARDDGPHTLIVRADGFEARQVEARFTSDVTFDVALSQLVPTPAVASAAPEAPAKPDARPAGKRPPSPAKGSSQRRIDEEDPYKQ